MAEDLLVLTKFYWQVRVTGRSGSDLDIATYRHSDQTWDVALCDHAAARKSGVAAWKALPPRSKRGASLGMLFSAPRRLRVSLLMPLSVSVCRSGERETPGRGDAEDSHQKTIAFSTPWRLGVSPSPRRRSSTGVSPVDHGRDGHATGARVRLHRA